MWIKICANTNLADAQLAARLGADAVGFVFATSKRQVTPEQVARITPHLPFSIERVGVFDSLDAEEIAAAVRTAGLNAIQLHGGIDHDLVRRLRARLSSEIKIIQTIHWKVDDDGASAASVAQQLHEIAGEGNIERVLIDSKVGTATGGTGITFDWEKARAIFAQHEGQLQMIVAGGLRPENVAEAIHRLSPWGIDVASGVEAGPGKKDPERLAAFIRTARN